VRAWATDQTSKACAILKFGALEVTEKSICESVVETDAKEVGIALEQEQIKAAS